MALVVYDVQLEEIAGLVKCTARPRGVLDRRAIKLGDAGGVAKAKQGGDGRFEWIFDQRNLTKEVFNGLRPIGVQKNNRE